MIPLDPPKKRVHTDGLEPDAAKLRPYLLGQLCALFNLYDDNRYQICTPTSKGIKIIRVTDHDGVLSSSYKALKKLYPDSGDSITLSPYTPPASHSESPAVDLTSTFMLEIKDSKIVDELREHGLKADTYEALVLRSMEHHFNSANR
jgi:hypothetical protein